MEAYLSLDRTVQPKSWPLWGRPGTRLLMKGASGDKRALLFVASFPFHPTLWRCLCSVVKHGHALHFPFAWMCIYVPEGATELPPGQCGEASKEWHLGLQLPFSPCTAWQGQRAQARFLWARPAAVPPTTRGHKEAGQPPRRFQNRTWALNVECSDAAARHATVDGQGGSWGLFCTWA